MKKSILLIITLAFLNACAEYTALVGPTYTMVKSGSIAHTGTSYASSYAIKKTLGQSPGEYVTSLVRKNNEEVGIEGSKKIINNNFNSSLADELDNISKEVISNSSKDKLDDDLTILTIGR